MVQRLPSQIWKYPKLYQTVHLTSFLIHLQLPGKYAWKE